MGSVPGASPRRDWELDPTPGTARNTVEHAAPRLLVARAVRLEKRTGKPPEGSQLLSGASGNLGDGQ